MKTQEEKAKAYDEAVERARKLESPFYKQAAEIIFPTLAESEDERIRKEILALVKKHAVNHKRCQMEDWLEKQKEQKPVDEKSVDEIGKRVRKKWAIDFISFLDEHRYDGKMCVSNGECMDIENAFISADWEKLIRYYNKYTQKPAEITPNQFDGIAYGMNGYSSKKPAEWSEDEKIIKNVIDVLQAYREEFLSIYSKDYVKDLINKLKSITVLPITYALDAPLCFDNDMNPIYPPINHWKPSEEQMRALFDVYINEIDKERRRKLRSIYNDLKKL